MDEYNDPDTVQLGKSFFNKSGTDSPTNSQRTMSMCIERTQGAKTTVSRNISSSPTMSETSKQKSGSFKSSLKRIANAGLKRESVRSNKTICADTIMEGNESTPKNDSQAGSSKESHRLDDSVDIEKSEKETHVNGNAMEKVETSQIHNWGFYFKRCGWALILVFSVSSCFYQSIKVYSDLWLNELVDQRKSLIEVEEFYSCS